ncbi:hypothetical protein G6F57_021497 [Rhizopus arrhizus]|nr:hypothetical protein G6F57_021497 [Rhizopus arrhizus]
MPIPDVPTDFLEGVKTWGGNGGPDEQGGVAIHMYAANRSMQGPGTPALGHRAGPDRSGPPGNRGDPARRALSRRTPGWRRARLHAGELRRRPALARTGPHRLELSGERARLPDAGGLV